MDITNFRNLKLAQKIGLGSVIPLILFVIVGTVTVFSLRSLDEISGWVDHLTKWLPRQSRSRPLRWIWKPA